MIEHTNKVVAVTGSGRGLGKVIAQTFAAAGAKVAILDIIEETAKATAEAIAAEQKATTWAGLLDVANKDSVVAAFKAVRDALGPVDILVNNAAITTNIGTIINMPMENWDQEITVNLSGAFYCAKQVLPDMVERKWGRILVISSVAGIMGGYGQCSYSSSKAGLLGLMKTIALEHGRHGVTANALVPGLINTEIVGFMPEETKQRIVKRVPSRRMAEPQEVADVASFLASDEARYMNGAEVRITGGGDLFTF